MFRVDNNAGFHAPHTTVPSSLRKTKVNFEENLVVVIVHTTIDILGCKKKILVLTNSVKNHIREGGMLTCGPKLHVDQLCLV